ncbi:thiol-disulfide isomerase, partial [Candidatus Sumerlaeota bacterium]|nr:thiol-disulfide isomerase [Candidatus Sumerlaeota bacterium]
MRLREWIQKAGLVASACLTLIGPGRAGADDFNQSPPTYNKDIAPIFFSKCVGCHRPGEAAPMTLLTYQETRPWVKSIKNSVVKRDMPPWDANPEHGKWVNDISLTEGQIATIAKWVDSGAPEGNTSDLPPAPEFKDGWQLGTPDYVIDMPEVDVPATGNDYFPNLDLSLDIPEKHWVRAVEVRPGNRDVLHHIVLFTSGLGMASAGGTFDALAVWAVGTGPVVYPEGSGRWVNPKMHLTANMHYHPNGTAQKDKTQVALYFGKGEIQKEISSAIAGELNFKIPPNTDNYTLKSTYYVNQDINVISLFPHMHMRGKHMTFVAKYPDGTEKTLLDVPKYDFNWQWFYYPAEKLTLPADTEIEITGIYDNTSNNPNNPDPNATLTFGEQSQDEMMFGFLEFSPVEGVKP